MGHVLPGEREAVVVVRIGLHIGRVGRAVEIEVVRVRDREWPMVAVVVASARDVILAPGIFVVREDARDVSRAVIAVARAGLLVGDAVTVGVVVLVVGQRAAGGSEGLGPVPRVVHLAVRVGVARVRAISLPIGRVPAIVGDVAAIGQAV